MSAPWVVGAGPAIFGIVNATPDSFSDGGRLGAAAVDHALRLLDEGAWAVDVGGESTRPGAAPVSVEEELARVLPVIRGVRASRPDAVVSVDTRRAAVAARAIEAGAAWVNDVSAGADPAMAGLVREAGVGWILMHMRGEPATMQADTRYDDLVGEVVGWLEAKVAAAVAAGVPASALMIDPGVGFGKAMEDNPALIAAVPRLARVAPVMIGASRKAFIGRLTGVGPASDRVHGSVGAALAAAALGAAALRVHDVAATRQALVVFQACARGGGSG
jgi:dihydropteroate synthase